ncbi:MAG: phytoene/squalene synthase family protein [Jatrophihabitantaceae bacterium]
MSSSQTGDLDAAYRYCRRLNAQHGKTFYLATGLLPKPSRRHVHALYGFARYADDLVDQPGVLAPEQRLAELTDQLRAGLDGSTPANPVVRAACHTVVEFGIQRSYLTDFLASMAADLTVTRYPSFAELRGYMWGSASVIGLQLLPILGVDGDRGRAEECASELGVAFQLTNFLRDVGEDYRRGRIYLPHDSMAEHGVTEAMLAAGVATPQLQALLAAEIERARGCYRRAEPGIGLLAPTARDCVRTAFTLYGEILDEIERADYQVLAGRVRVSLARRFRVGGAGYLRAVRARR